MRPEVTLHYEFVEFIPDDIKDGTIYVSIRFATAVHRCCCGCGKEVVTPLSPTDWKLTFDGKTVSLDPSIGNWSFPCRSHYWVRRNRVNWAYQMSKEEIAAGRAKDRHDKKRYFSPTPKTTEDTATDTTTPPARGAAVPSRWQRVKRFWRREPR